MQPGGLPPAHAAHAGVGYHEDEMQLQFQQSEDDLSKGDVEGCGDDVPGVAEALNPPIGEQHMDVDPPQQGADDGGEGSGGEGGRGVAEGGSGGVGGGGGGKSTMASRGGGGGGGGGGEGGGRGEGGSESGRGDQTGGVGSSSSVGLAVDSLPVGAANSDSGGR